MKLPSGGLQPKAGPVPQEINPPTSGTAAKEKGGVMSEDVELMLLRELLLKLKKTEAKRDEAQSVAREWAEGVTKVLDAMIPIAVALSYPATGEAAKEK